MSKNKSWAKQEYWKKTGWKMGSPPDDFMFFTTVPPCAEHYVLERQTVCRRVPAGCAVAFAIHGQHPKRRKSG